MTRLERIAKQRMIVRKAIGELKAVTELFGVEDDWDDSFAEHEDWENKIDSFEKWVFETSSLA